MLPEVDKTKNPGKIPALRLFNYLAGVAELADALRSGRSGHYARVGSNPTFGTGTIPASYQQGFLIPLHEQ
jgi:hypothetical protein